MFLAENLKYLRTKNGMEQLELADLLGKKSASSISSWESGIYTPTLSTVVKIAEIFNVEVSDLLNKQLNKKWSINEISVQTVSGISLEPTNNVEKPRHYQGILGLMVETVLRNFIPRYKNTYIAHRVGSAVEYLLRAPLKNGVEDIKKAHRNLGMLLEELGEDETI